MKNYFSIILFFTCLLFFSCSDKKGKSVVLVFEEVRSPADYVSPSGHLRKKSPHKGVISYVENNEVKFYNPKVNFDTLQLKVAENGLEIQFKEKIAPFNYLLQQGDTIMVTVDKFGKPFLKSKVSQQNTDFYNFPHKITTGQQYLGMSPLVGLVYFAHELGRIEVAKTQRPDIYEFFKDGYVSIDSLIVSFELYNENFEKELNAIKQKNEFSEEQVNYLRYIKRLNESFFTWGKARCSKEKPEKGAFVDFYDDDYVNYVSYRDFLQYAFGYYYELAENIPHLHGGIGTKVDSRETFNCIASNNEIPSNTKKYALKITLEKLLAQFGKEEEDIYLKRYKELTNDTSFEKEKQKENYALEELLLKDLFGNQITFQKLLQKYRGRVIYIDFWASWCIPCREQMPKGKELHKKFKDKDIVFLYFALNDNEEAWTKVCKKLEIEENSYFVINPKTAKFIADNKIKSIPRYLLFDKTGILVDRNAPHPKDDNVEIILEKYLK